MEGQNRIQKKTQARGVIMLLITAFIWGVAFVSQSVGMEKVEAFTFNGIRTLMGGIALLIFVLVRDKINEKAMGSEQLRQRKKTDRKTIICGTGLGFIFCVASNLQQFAFEDSTSGKIAFITAMYMFFVPLFGLFLRKHVSRTTWICVLLGFVGLYFLCIDVKGIGSINKGDVLAFGCAIVFAVHILLVERFAPDVDGIKLSCVQFMVSGIISCIFMFVFETPKLAAIGSAAVPLLYSGLLSCCVAYTFQIIGQKYTEATIASLLMSMESVFAVLAAAVILHEILSVREVVGCVIMFAAIIISQFAEMRN